jgi:hypothetical protein
VTATDSDYIDQALADLLLEEALEEQGHEEPEAAEEWSLPTDALIVELCNRIVDFSEMLADSPMFPYQREFAFRLVESIVTNDGEEITALQARQSGKTQVVSQVIAGCMVILPKLASLPAFAELLEKFRKGLMVGVFAPVEEQAQTLWGRVVTWLTSDHATEILMDDEIDDKVMRGGGARTIVLKKSGSLCRQQTANPKAKIESKSYHLVVIDECQEADAYTINKSIRPMMAFYNGTIVLTGTPARTKGEFYRAIQRNKRRMTNRGAKQNHFEYNWRFVAKYNPNYAKFIKKEIIRLGQDSEEFQLSYELKWLLDRGMFITEQVMEECGDKTMQLVTAWHQTPVIVGIDPARVKDSTVVTVVWVNWDAPDEFGYMDHRILNWLEIHGDDWEEQYFQIVNFLEAYRVYGIGIDSNGVGDPFADRIARLMPGAEVVPLGSTPKDQDARWKHLNELVGRRMVGWPAHPKTRRLKKWQRFNQQMQDLEKEYRGPNLMAHAPETDDAHDDYPDSLALATVLTKDMIMTETQESENVFYGRRR